MATYKVAQDVEADDHLLGPFTARQFIYLIIVSMAGLLAFFLGKLFVPLAIIPLPVILFFGVLALPLRKDQPMEVYFAALISFYLKPRRRLWEPDGLTSLIEIIAPQAIEQQRVKSFSGSEAESRLGYLASIVDTEGWAIRHAAGAQDTNTSMISDVYNDAVATEDLLDTSSSVAQDFDAKLSAATERHRKEIMDRMRNPGDYSVPGTQVTTAVAAAPQPAAPNYSYQAPVQAPAAASAPQQYMTQPIAPQPQVQTQPSDLHFNPYPTIHQTIIQPLAPAPSAAATPQAPPMAATPAPVQPTPPVANPAESTSETAPSPDIMRLVNNSDLSVETIAREAHRLKGKDDSDEVVISLR